MHEFDRIAARRILAEGTEALQLTLTDAQQSNLINYIAMMSKWNLTYNLTAVRDPLQMVTQHLLDSLAVVPAFHGAANVLDVGSGGGLPGVVLAIWALVAQPDMCVSMIDTVQKKTAFLTQVKAELNLDNVSVYHARVERLQVARKFDVITSRAFAELSDFVTWTSHLLEQGGYFIALKGVAPHDEIARLPAGWTVTQVQPLTVPGLPAERHLVFIERAA